MGQFLTEGIARKRFYRHSISVAARAVWVPIISQPRRLRLWTRNENIVFFSSQPLQRRREMLTSIQLKGPSRREFHLCSWSKTANQPVHDDFRRHTIDDRSALPRHCHRASSCEGEAGLSSDSVILCTKYELST